MDPNLEDAAVASKQVAEQLAEAANSAKQVRHLLEDLPDLDTVLEQLGEAYRLAKGLQEILDEL